MATQKIIDLLEDKSSYLLDHQCTAIDKSTINLPSPTQVEDIWIQSNRSNQVLRSLQTLFNYGRLANTGYLSIFPVDQGIEHSAGASFAPNTLILKRLLSSLLREAAMQWHQRMVYLAL